MVIVLLTFLILRFQGKKTILRCNSNEQLYPVPDERKSLTTYIKKHYSKIELVKRKTMRSQKVSKDVDTWLRVLGQRICDIGVYAQDLNVLEKFAVVFIVNNLFHDGHSGAKKIKNYLLRTIVVYHRNEVRLKLVTRGKYADTYEISCSPWATHLPKSVIEGGMLERPGKPSAKRILR